VSERLDKFINLLKSKARPWSDVMDEMPRPGLRIVKIPGDIVRNHIFDDSSSMLLDQLFAQLPKDVCLMDADGRILSLDFNASSGAYCDTYFVVVASKEWEPLKEGAEIPELEVSFRKSIAKVTRIDARGNESAPITLDMAGSCITFPESDGNRLWRIYLPLHGFEAVGPWYEWQFITEECVDSLRVRRTLPVYYMDSDLSSKLPPKGESHAASFPAKTSDGDTWICENHLTPVPDIAKGAACPVCHRRPDVD
jgi:hypothetical protein